MDSGNYKRVALKREPFISLHIIWDSRFQGLRPVYTPLQRDPKP